MSHQELSMASGELHEEKILNENSTSVEIVEVNASGHVRDIAPYFFYRGVYTGISPQVDQLNRQYGLLSICATAINIGTIILFVSSFILRLFTYNDHDA